MAVALRERLAFLQAAPARCGLGIDVISDDATKTAMRAAVGAYADWQVENLRNKAPLRAEFFNSAQERSKEGAHAPRARTRVVTPVVSP